MYFCFLGSRIRTYFDFGYVALDLYSVTLQDIGEYTARATNRLGSAHTSAMIKVVGDSDIITDSLHEEGMQMIQHLEDSSRYSRTQVDDEYQSAKPNWIKALANKEALEGTNIHLEARLHPVGDPSMKIEWFVNGAPLKTGNYYINFLILQYFLSKIFMYC